MKQFYTLFLVLLVQCLPAQQAPQYSLYWLNPYAYNPAYAGLDNSLIATGVYRKQWSGLKGAPLTQHINAHLPVYVLRSGIGIRMENDIIGAHQRTSVALSYNYQLEFGRETMLSIGLSGGYLQYSLDGAKLRAPEGTYNEPAGDFDHNDPFLPEGKIRTGIPWLEWGFCLRIKKLEVSGAMQPAYAPTLSVSGIENFRLQPESHYLFSTMYRFNVADNLVLMPGIFVKSDITKTQTDISFVGRWKENIFAGVSYRGLGKDAKDAACLMGGLNLNEKTSLGYAFDIPLSGLSLANRGSHEILLRYNLNKPIGTGKLPPIIYNPRFF
jgi:type IX secretion system PorP/SprF family membrane protein